MKRVFRYACLLLCLALALTLLLACNPADPVNPDDSADESTPDEPEVPMVDVAKDGVTAFRLIRGDLLTASDVAVQATVTLRQAMIDATGAKPGITTDWDDKDNNADIKEILIGKTNRQESVDFVDGLAGNEYGYAVVNNKIVIAGATDELLSLAVSVFLD